MEYPLRMCLCTPFVYAIYCWVYIQSLLLEYNLTKSLNILSVDHLRIFFFHVVGSLCSIFKLTLLLLRVYTIRKCVLTTTLVRMIFPLCMCLIYVTPIIYLTNSYDTHQSLNLSVFDLIKSFDILYAVLTAWTEVGLSQGQQPGQLQDQIHLDQA